MEKIMWDKAVRLVSFSPTGTTQKVLDKIAIGIGSQNIEHINLTKIDSISKQYQSFKDELVIIGVPVYSGRVPADAVERLKQLKADNTLAILVVVYGNREFDDALLELKAISSELGFNPVAGAAFIGEHSFSTKEIPIAEGRPNTEDLQKAINFGASLAKKLQSTDSNSVLNIPGNFPYRSGARKLNIAPQTNEQLCSGCGKCVNLCPTGAISLNGIAKSDDSLCILCCACIKSCPKEARFWLDDTVKNTAKRLNTNCSEPKQPEFFGVTM